MKTYEVQAGAWTKTKTGETVFLTAQNAHDIGTLLTKSRIKALVAGGVLREFGEDDPNEPAEEDTETETETRSEGAPSARSGARRSTRE